MYRLPSLVAANQLHHPLQQLHVCLDTHLNTSILQLFLPVLSVIAATMSSEESDEPGSSHALHNLLADLNMPPPSIQRNVHLPTWSFPSAPVSRASPSPSLAEDISSGTIFSAQPASRNATRPAPELDLATVAPSVQPPSLFSNPSRSIFSSGPPIASVSANTAHASMSAPQPGARPIHYQL